MNLPRRISDSCYNLLPEKDVGPFLRLRTIRRNGYIERPDCSHAMQRKLLGRFAFRIKSIGDSGYRIGY